MGLELQVVLAVITILLVLIIPNLVYLFKQEKKLKGNVVSLIR